LQLRHLQTFIAITEEGTLTAAAARLYKTQGAVSHDLKSLEAECGLQLVDRDGQRIRLTPAGEAMLPSAREVVRRVHDLELMMQRQKRGELGDVIRLGTLTSSAKLVLDCAVAFHNDNPSVGFVINSEVRGVLISWLREGILDLAIAEPGTEADLRATVIARDDLRVVVPTDDPLAGEEYLTPEQLVDRPFVGFTRELGSSELASRFFMSVGRYPSPVVEANDSRLVKDLVRRGIGFALMPLSTVFDEPGLAVVPPEPVVRREIAVLQSRHHVKGSMISNLHEYLVRSLVFPGAHQA
jgi:DNA-binding transcriptional LysR family regulator